MHAPVCRHLLEINQLLPAAVPGSAFCQAACSLIFRSSKWPGTLVSGHPQKRVDNVIAGSDKLTVVFSKWLFNVMRAMFRGSLTQRYMLLSLSACMLWENGQMNCHGCLFWTRTLYG